VADDEGLDSSLAVRDQNAASEGPGWDQTMRFAVAGSADGEQAAQDGGDADSGLDSTVPAPAVPAPAVPAPAVTDPAIAALLSGLNDEQRAAVAARMPHFSSSPAPARERRGH